MIRKTFNQPPAADTTTSPERTPIPSLSRRNLLLLGAGGFASAAGLYRIVHGKNDNSGTAAQVERAVIFGADTSTSFERLLPQAVDQAGRLVMRLDSKRDLVTVCRVDYMTTEVYRCLAPQSKGIFSSSIVGDLSKPPRQSMTRPGQFFEYVNKSLALAPSRASAVIYLSDGDEDDPKDLPLLQSAARRICRNPRVHAVIIWGIDATNRSLYRRSFAELKDRLILDGAGQLDTDSVLCLLNKPVSGVGGAK